MSFVPTHGKPSSLSLTYYLFSFLLSIIAFFFFFSRLEFRQIILVSLINAPVVSRLFTDCLGFLGIITQALHLGTNLWNS